MRDSSTIPKTGDTAPEAVREINDVPKRDGGLKWLVPRQPGAAVFHDIAGEIFRQAADQNSIIRREETTKMLVQALRIAGARNDIDRRKHSLRAELLEGLAKLGVTRTAIRHSFIRNKIHSHARTRDNPSIQKTLN